jgi:hypothetical protein
MMGFDSFGVILVFVALSLMTVDPLHVTIARAKARSAPITAMMDDQAPRTPLADAGDTDRLADELLQGEPFNTAITDIARIYDQA